MSTSSTPRQAQGQEESLADQKITESLSHLVQLKQQGFNEVTKVRIDADHEENERRINQEVAMENLKKKLHQEGEDSDRKSAAVAMRWPSIQNKKIPQEIQQELDQQTKDCARIINAKNELITLLQKTLEQKDHEYVSALKKQAQDIDKLSQRMATQIEILNQEYTKQMQQIELAFNHQREAGLTNHKEELNKLKEERKRLEKKFVEDRLLQVEENEKELSNLRDREMEKYAETKKEKDEKVHELERSIDYMRAKYELYSEKLKYYHNVLFERVDENKAAIRNNKSKLAKLQDQLSGIKAKYDKDDKKFKQENAETTEQYKRMAKQYKDLLIKFKYFEKADLSKYKEVWKMNEKIVKDLADKLLKADRLISEQLLGETWIPPDESIMRSPMNPSYSPRGPLGTGSDTMSKGDGSSILTSTTSVLTPSATTQPGQQLPLETKKKILEHLCDSSGYLVEEKVSKAIENLVPEEGRLLKVDAILRALGVQNAEETDDLINFFAKKIQNDVDLEQLSDGAVSEQKKKEILQHHISADEVVKDLSQFIKQQQNVSTTMRSKIKKKKPKILTAKERARNKRRTEEREFWKRLERIIPEEKYRVWNALEIAQEKYGKLLRSREKLIEETEMIRLQNTELSNLLQTYRQQKINSELYVSPQFSSLN